MPAAVFVDVDFGQTIIPKKTLSAIQNIQYGTNAKILVPFPVPYNKQWHPMHRFAASFFNYSNDLLTIYPFGKNGCFTAETITDTYREYDSLFELSFGLENLPKVAPVYAKDEVFASYHTPIGYSWANDPYIKGSYSFVAAGQDEILTTLEEYQGETIRSLFVPLNGDTLYFAGEHTSNLLHYSATMEAACESGERTARMIMQHLIKI